MRQCTSRLLPPYPRQRACTVTFRLLLMPIAPFPSSYQPGPVIVTPIVCTYAAAPTAPGAAARTACSGLTFLPSLLYRTLGGGARLRRPSRERTLCEVSSSSPGSQENAVILDEPNNLPVDGARDAVLQLQVHLGHGVLCEYRGIGNITCALYN